MIFVPGTSGLDLSKLLREIDPQVPVLFFPAAGYEKDSCRRVACPGDCSRGRAPVMKVIPEHVGFRECFAASSNLSVRAAKILCVDRDFS